MKRSSTSAPTRGPRARGLSLQAPDAGSGGVPEHHAGPARAGSRGGESIVPRQLDPTRRLLFAVNELDEFEGKPTGAVSAFSVDAASGMLKPPHPAPRTGTCRSTCPSKGTPEPPRRELRQRERGGCPSRWPAWRRHGRRSTRRQEHQSRTPDRAACPLRHAGSGQPSCVRVRPRARQNPERLSPHEPAFTPIKAGAGPRHMVFRPDGRFAYVVNELNSTITVLRYDSSAGVLSESQTISTLPEYFDGANSGQRSASILRANTSTCRTAVTTASCSSASIRRKARSPTSRSKARAASRHFGIEPSAQHLAIANRTPTRFWSVASTRGTAD